MAISVEGGHLVIHDGRHTGYATAHVYITTLLSMMQSVTEDERLSSTDLYYM